MCTIRIIGHRLSVFRLPSWLSASAAQREKKEMGNSPGQRKEDKVERGRGKGTHRPASCGCTPPKCPRSRRTPLEAAWYGCKNRKEGEERGSKEADRVSLHAGGQEERETTHLVLILGMASEESGREVVGRGRTTGSRERGGRRGEVRWIAR